MRKRDSKRRWKARLKLGKWIPLTVMEEHPELRPKPTEALLDAYRFYMKWVNHQ